MLKLIFKNRTDASFTEKDFAPLLKEAEKFLPPIPEEEVELGLLNDKDMQNVNFRTRGIDETTDVLAFANREIEQSGFENDPSLGQIFISVPVAERNAEDIRQPLEEELKFLFIHGLLHILGYDHQNKDDETEMMTLAYQILGRAPYVPD